MPDVEVEGPDGKTYQFPDGTDKNAAIGYFKAKGIGVSRSASSPIPPPPIQRPNIPVEKEYLLGGGKVRPLTEQIGELAEGALKSTGHLAAMFPVVEHRILQKHGIMGPGSRLFPGEHTMEQVQKEDVPNAVAGIATGMEGGGGGGERPATRPARASTIPEPPRAMPLDPESQAKYTAAIDKTNQEFKEQSVGYHDKVSKAFDEAKREQLDFEKKQKLEQGSKEATRALHDNLQRTYRTARGALDQRWAEFRKGMEGAELDPTQTFNQIEAAKGKYLKGSPSSLTAFNNLAREMGIQEFMEGEGGELKAIPGTGKLPFDTARVHYSAIGDKLAQGGLPGNVYQALKAVQDGLDSQLGKAAESRGLGDAYAGLKSEEHEFRSDWMDAKSPLARAHRTLDSNLLEPHVMGRGSQYLTKQLDKYRRYGAEPHLPLVARRLMESSKAIKARGGVPESSVPKPPELREVVRPKPKANAPKAGKMSRMAGRVAGKVIGGTVGGALGHPLLGYGIGGELGTEAMERIARRKSTLPPPPE